AGSIPANGSFLLERTDDTTIPAVAADQIYSGALGNDGEDLVLRDNTNAIVDQVDSSLGWFSGHNEARVPMVRVDPLAAGGSDNWTYNPRCGTPTNSAGVSYSCTLTTTVVGQELDYRVYFNELAPTATVTTTTITPKEGALIALLESATTTIDFAMYGFNRQSIVDELIAAHGRGVQVRVVGDDEAATGEYQAFYQALVDAGITIAIDSSMSQIQHNKFVIVDDLVVWTGSTNYTDTGFTLNANNSVIITDATMAEIYGTEFAEMWAGSFHGAKLDNTAHLFDYNGTLVESYFSPTDLPAFAVRDRLLNAQQSIHFAMFFWTDDVLTQATIEQIGYGVEVWGLFDQLGAGNASSADEPLCAAGARIGIESSAGKLHHKFAVIDVFGADPVVILGSYNWTDSGAYDNDENTLIIHDAQLAQAYYAEWQRQWSNVLPEDICNARSIYLPIITRP
ncbi:MAG: hypothetical protein KDE34_19730, partial [Anaerolineales bacterium]|nr:hypothetical protein [Anaerolineales bacterium]